MSSLTLAVGRPTLIDRVFSRGLVIDLVLLGAGAALVALSAQLSIPLWPVPITAQTLAVLLVGACLGAVRGALSLLLYVGLGAAGLPIFSKGNSGFEALTGPTGGFIIGFVFAAALAGWLAQRRWDRRFPSGLAAFLLASTLPFVFGLPWLAYSLGELGEPNDLHAVLDAGLYRFVIGEIVKVIVAASLVRLAWYGVERVDQRQADEPE